MPRYSPLNINERYQKGTKTFNNISPDLFRHSENIEKRARQNFNKLFPKPPPQEELLNKNYVTNNKFIGPIKLAKHDNLKPGNIKIGRFTIHNKSDPKVQSIKTQSHTRRKFTISEPGRSKSHRKRKFKITNNLGKAKTFIKAKKRYNKKKYNKKM
tara:strand:- start:2339 stop:2806 length:468 start_codon:yes stop_codon:yes gene_type:complete